MKYQIINGAITLGTNTILEEVNIDIKEGNKIGIVGKNGAGKTTLLKGLIDNSLFEEGLSLEKFQIIKYGNFNIGYQEQIKFDDNSTLYEEILKSYRDLVDMEKRLDKMLQMMNENPTEENISKYTDLENMFRNLDGYSYKSNCEMILNKFKFTKEDYDRKISDFSGGQKTKIAFMKLLLQKPDLLILDEPTNHLDLDTIIWLEEYLKNYKKTLIIVSHDREFLNNIVNVIYEIDYGKTTKYVGNYEHYEKEKKENYEKLLKDYDAQQKEIKRLQAIYERFRSKPSKASMALAKLKQIERMEIIEKPRRQSYKSFKINLRDITKTGKIALTIKELVIGYDKPLAKVNVTIESAHRLGIIGKNGTGKSTLLKTLSDLIKPIEGNYKFGYNANVAYFDQSLAMISNDYTVIEEFSHFHPELSLEEVRSALGAFMFHGEDVNKKICVLSGGEKVRLELCKILYNKPNILLLDEPTNHLDMASIERLEDILSSYPGTIIFVSHDRYFINKLATELLIFDSYDVTYYPYSYKEYMLSRKKDNPVVDKKNIKSKKNESKPKDNKEINKLEKEISEKENLLKELTNDLLKEEVYSNYLKAEKINNEIEKEKILLEDLNNKWLHLMENANE